MAHSLLLKENELLMGPCSFPSPELNSAAQQQVAPGEKKIGVLFSVRRWAPLSNKIGNGWLLSSPVNCICMN